jgi:hypothetical protein
MSATAAVRRAAAMTMTISSALRMLTPGDGCSTFPTQAEDAVIKMHPAPSCQLRKATRTVDQILVSLEYAEVG